jgi:tryptophan-rich sensory protein
LRAFSGLIGWLVVTFAASAIGALASVEAAEFYGELQQPAWAPPPWLFGPVWTVLYAMMGLAAWTVWRSGGFGEQRVALGLFLTQLGLNALWSWLFFTWRLGGLAFAEIVMLWVCIFATLILFWRVRRVAGMLLVPYLAWVSFAAALNFVLWRQNPLVL